MQIYKQLIQLQSMEISVQKTGVNPHYRHKYLTLDTIISVYSKVLSDLWLLVYHNTINSTLYTSVICVEDNSMISTEFPISGTSPQQIWSSITYAKRYNICQLLNISTWDDDDWNASSLKTNKPKIEAKKPFDIDALARLTDSIDQWLIPFSTEEDKIELIKKAEKGYDMSQDALDMIDLLYQHKIDHNRFDIKTEDIVQDIVHAVSKQS